MRFVLRHLIATAAVTLLTAALGALTYFALLGWAVSHSQPLGGPFALPFMVLLGLGLGLVASLLILLPLTTAARVLRTSLPRTPPLLELVALASMAAVLVGVACTVIGVTTSASYSQLALGAVIATTVLFVLLFAYWLVLAATEAIIAGAVALFRLIGARPGPDAPNRGAA